MRTKSNADQAPTTGQLGRAALLAQLKIAEQHRPGGAHDMIASLPSDLQKVVMEVVDTQ